MQQDIVKYATLNEGLSFGASNITMVLNPSHVNEVDSNLDSLMRGLAYTEKGREKLRNLKQDFIIQFSFNNYELLPKHYSVDSGAYKEGTKSSIVAFGGVENDIIYDLKVDLNLRVSPPLIMANHKRAQVYIRVHTDEIEGGGFAYYQEIGRAQDSSVLSKYSSDITVGAIEYNHEKYFVKDILTRAREDLYNEKGEVDQELIYTPRNNKKLKGVKDGGNMILRPYDDYTRKRALMYEVVAIVDNWGGKDVSKLKDLQTELNTAIEADNKAAETKLLKSINRLEKKMQQKSLHRFDYVLKNPVSLHNAEEALKFKAQENLNKRAQKKC